MSKWWPLVAICLGTFVLLLDLTIVNVALPAMATSLNARFSDLQWVVDGYVVGLVVLPLTFGTLADLHGRRRGYLIGLVLFAATSLACGLATTPMLLIGARVAQGVGGALMFATTLALLSRTYGGRDRGTAYGVWGAVLGGATAIGPIAGGVLTEYLSWRWIFLVNVPICAAAVGLSLAVLAESANPRARRVDWPGVLLFSFAMTCLLLGLIDTAAWAPWMYLVSTLALAAFVVIELRRDEPMLDLGLLRNRAFLAVSIAAMTMPFAVFSLFLFLALWTQSVLGMSPVQAGLVFMPLSLVQLATSILSGKYLHTRIAERTQITVGLLVCGCSVLLFRGLDNHSSWPALMPGMLLGGLGVGLASAPLISAAMSVVPPDQAGMASGANSTFQRLGSALGIAILGVLFAHEVQSQLAVSGTGTGIPGFAAAVAGGGTPELLAATPQPARAALADHIKTGFTAGLNHTFTIAATVAFIGAAVAWSIKTPEVQDVSHRTDTARIVPEPKPR